MAQKGRTLIKADFETGDIPTEAQYIDLIDSLLNITDDDSDDITEGITKLLMTVAERAKIAFNALGTFDGSLIELSTSGSHTALTMSADLVVTFAESGHVDGSVQLVDITADGTDTLTFVKPSAYILDIPLSLTNGAVLASGKHQLVILFTPGVINVQLNARQNVPVVIPTVLSMAVEDAEPNQLVWTFSEACTGSEQGIDFEVDNVDRSITYLSGSGTSSIIFTISGAAILSSDTLTAALTSGDLAAVAAPQNSVADFAEDTVTNNVLSVYTAFNGTTNYAWAGDILDSLFEANDAKFAFEFTVQNWSTNTVRLIAKYDTVDNVNGLHWFYSTGNGFRFSYGDGTNRDTITSPNLTVSNDDVLRLEYDGSIDTAAEDRVLFKKNGTTVGATGNASAVGAFPHLIANPGNDSLAIGDQVDGAGVNDGAVMFDGGMKDFKIYDSNTGGNLVAHIPTISVGTDIVGSNDFTFV